MRGKACRRSPQPSGCGDHPRMCGEKRPLFCRGLALAGSPPHVRGKDIRVEGMTAKERITPACAGKSRDAHRAQDCSRDHPRMCGEKTLYIGIGRTVVGSPPRVRGKGARPEGDPPLSGITPACAGKSAGCQSRRQGIQDHPRMCGEKLRIRPRTLFGFRITPACAGKSIACRVVERFTWDHPRMCGEKTKKIP